MWIDIFLYAVMAFFILWLILMIIYLVGMWFYDHHGKYVKFYHDKDKNHRIDWNGPMKFRDYPNGARIPYRTCKYCNARYYMDYHQNFKLEDEKEG